MNIGRKLRKIITISFIAVIFFVFISGLINTIFFPDVLSEYENRYANKLEPLTASSYMDGSFQESMDAALGDQVDLSSTFKKIYNRITSRIYHALLYPLISSEEMKNNYCSMKSGWIFGGDSLLSYPYDASRVTELEHAAENYNRIFASWPDTEFFVYYVERGIDINFSTGEKPDFSGQFFNLLDIPQENKDAFSIDSFEQYQENFYRTDHHWKYTGSYRGYIELLDLLGCEDEPLLPVSEYVFPGDFYGSHSRGDLSCYKEKFAAYVFDFPVMECRVDGYESINYGNQEFYLSENQPVKTYGSFYGVDSGEVYYSTCRPERDDLLIIGDSYDNAVIRLLATHFNNTYAVDPRDYEVYMYTPFSIEHYIEDCGVDKVLFLGNFDTLSTRSFHLGD